MEAQIPNLKSYVLCEISASGHKIEKISNSVNTTLKKLKNKDNKKTGILIYWEKYHYSATTTTTIQPFQSNVKVRSQRKHWKMFVSMSHTLNQWRNTQFRSTLSEITIKPTHFRRRASELVRTYQSQKVTHNKFQGVNANKLYIGNSNDSITTENIYELFGLKSTICICQQAC